MQTICWSQALGFLRTIWKYNPEDWDLHIHRRDDHRFNRGKKCLEMKRSVKYCFEEHDDGPEIITQ
jgi:hypothetical protein